MQTAGAGDVAAAAGATMPVADIIRMAAGVELDTGRTADDGRTDMAALPADGAIRRTDGLDGIPLYDSTNNDLSELT